MMEISRQLLGLATQTAEHMLQDGVNIMSIGATGFYLLSSGHGLAGYTPLYEIEVSGSRFAIAWEK